MTIRKTKQLSDLGTLIKQIESFVPTSEVETETKALLIRLARAHRAELRRELVTSRIKNRAA